jgi:hypothetical protein
MRTTKELLSLTSPEVNFRSKYIKIVGIKSRKFTTRTMKTPKGDLRVLNIRIELNARSQNIVDKIYPIELEIPVDVKNQRKLLANSPIRVYCGCPDFKYRLAYHLNVTSNVIRKKDLGLALTIPPSKSNRSGLCKHLAAALRWVSNKSLRQLLEK